MNKKTLKIAGWALGLSMAVAGIGVAVGAPRFMGDEPAVVNAAEVVYKTALFGSDYNSKGVSGYTGVSFSSTNSGFKVNLANFNNNNNGWDYVKCGGKNGAYTGTIITDAVIDKAISRVTITIDAVTAENVTSIKLYSSNNKSSWTEVGTFSAAVGAQSVLPANPTKNLYYKIEAVCTKATNNGVVTISRVDYVYDDVVHVTSVDIEEESADLYLNTDRNTKTLTTTISPDDATNKAMTWTSTPTGVVTVNSTGVVTASSAGTTTVTAASNENGSIKDTCDVTVWSAVGIVVTNPIDSGVRTSYAAGDDPDYTGLIATITWSNGTTTKEEDVTALATWTDTGAPSAGDESIFFNAAYAGVNADFELAVTVAAEPIYPTSVSVSYSDTTLYVGDDEEVASTGYLPAEANQLAFGFSSSDSTVLSVDSSGAVTALKAGSATITYFSDYDGKRDTVKASVNFTVENRPATGVTLSSYSGSIDVDSEETLDFTVTVEGSPTITGYTVTVTDGTIVDYSKLGNVVSLTPKKAGTTTVVVASDATPAMTATYTVTVNALPAYTLVTDVTQLTIGNKVIIVNADATQAMLPYDSGNNCDAVSITTELDGTISKGSSAEFTALTIGADKTGYTLKDENGYYLYAASSSNNYLKGTKSLDKSGNDHWSISINASNEAIITGQGSNARNVIRYNSGSTLFSCYESGQGAVKLYVLNANPSATDKVETFSQLYMHKADVATDVGGTGKCISENWFSKARTALSGDWSSVAADFAVSGDMWDRYVAWGAAQTPKVVVTYDDGIKYGAYSVSESFLTSNDISGLPIVITILSAGALAAGGLFLTRKRRSEEE